MWFIRTKAFLAALLIASLLACAPMQQRWNPNDYTVQSGDTLYSIAWRYEKDFRNLARWNKIKAPYAIYPGQRIIMAPDSLAGTVDHEDKQPLIIDSKTGQRIDVSSVIKKRPAISKPPQITPAVIKKPQKIVVKKGDTLYSISRKQGIPVHKLSRWNALKQTHALYPGQVLRLIPPITIQQKQHAKPIAVQVKKPATLKLPAKVSHWYWPTKGRLIKTFKSNDNNRKGIGISGKRGQAIKATAAGQVVYSGNGLISYGNLVIIKHSNSFLSAYAYNQKLLVKEGDKVRAQQKIAQMGSAGEKRAQLHFEIRRNGKPINPLKYLP